MSVQLPLPYIRPFGSKCFAGGLLHVRGSGFKPGDLPGNRQLRRHQPAPRRRHGFLGFYSMCKTLERKEFSSHRNGILADNRPTMFDAKNGQMVSRKPITSPNCPHLRARLVRYSGHSSDLLRTIRPRRGARAAECGGLLTLHAQQCAKRIRVKCGRIGLSRLVRKWSRFAFGASVIDCHVQAAEAREGVVNKFLDISFLAHIRPHKLRFSTESSKLDDKLLSLFIVAARNDDLCPFSGESNRSCPSNPRQCSCNQNYLV